MSEWKLELLKVGDDTVWPSNDETRMSYIAGRNIDLPDNCRYTFGFDRNVMSEDEAKVHFLANIDEWMIENPPKETDPAKYPGVDLSDCAECVHGAYTHPDGGACQQCDCKSFERKRVEPSKNELFG